MNFQKREIRPYCRLGHQHYKSISSDRNQMINRLNAFYNPTNWQVEKLSIFACILRARVYNNEKESNFILRTRLFEFYTEAGDNSLLQVIENCC